MPSVASAVSFSEAATLLTSTAAPVWLPPSILEEACGSSSSSMLPPSAAIFCTGASCASPLFWLSEVSAVSVLSASSEASPCFAASVCPSRSVPSAVCTAAPAGVSLLFLISSAAASAMTAAARTAAGISTYSSSLCLRARLFLLLSIQKSPFPPCLSAARFLTAPFFTAAPFPAVICFLRQPKRTLFTADARKAPPGSLPKGIREPRQIRSCSLSSLPCSSGMPRARTLR